MQYLFVMNKLVCEIHKKSRDLNFTYELDSPILLVKILILKVAKEVTVRSIMFQTGCKIECIILCAIHRSLKVIVADTRNKILLYRTIISKRAELWDRDEK